VRSVAGSIAAILLTTCVSPGAVRADSPRGELEVRLAIRRAEARTARPECEAIYHDFHDEAGRPLSDRLSELGQTGRQNFRDIAFRLVEDAPACRAGGVLAFTSPGSRDVRLCRRAFTEAVRRDERDAVATLIHEQLHGLGLGENPPTSREITDRVLRRCLP
jgi:hypothetical protein